MINEYKNWSPRSFSIVDASGVAFVQKGKNGDKQKDKSDTSWHQNATCHKCGKKGHISPNCTETEEAKPDETNDPPTVKTSNKSKTQKGKKHVTLACVSSEELSDSENSDFGFCNANFVSAQLNLRDLILLDNQSTVDIFCNKRLLRDIHVTNDDMTVHGNGGALTTNKKGTLKNYGEVWYHKDAITNILSLKMSDPDFS